MLRSDPELDPLERIVEEFTARCRNGESPAVADYTARYPQQAEQLEELLPAAAALEQVRLEDRVRREAVLRRTSPASPPEELGDFQILRQIGRGGMGIVYQAQQQSLGRAVAVKVLPRHALLLERRVERFQREARTAARLRHTNIVPVFGAGEQDGLHYYVMPLVRGVGLDEVIRRLEAGRDGSAAADVYGVVRALTAEKFGPPGAGTRGETDAETPARGAPRGERNAWRAIAAIGLQAADALAYAHSQGTLHRDIKPANLLLGEEGEVSVADFGLARAMDDAETGRGADLVGTARYMAPEQAHGTADARSDLYSLGVTLYELAVLKPAQGGRPPEASSQAADSPRGVVPPRQIERTMPRDLESIVLKCLAAEPAGRYQTAADLAADLRRFLADRPVRARRTPALERIGRWCRRNPALAAVSALAAVLLLACAATALVGHLHTRAAYTQTRLALEQSEATSQVALEVLERIYAQFSPERMWIASDSDPAAQACACVGLSAGDRSASSVERTALRARASPETAAMLENLLAFYDRLAAQGDEDFHVTLQQAVACRRMGDIRLCQGQLDRAEQEYRRAAGKLATLRQREPTSATLGEAVPGLAVDTEFARCLNEIGSIQSARREVRQAWQSHQEALRLLQAGAAPPTAESRYELARTLYFLAGKSTAATGGSRSERTPQSASSPQSAQEYRAAAIGLLEGLIADAPRAPDYRLLLALCCRGSATELPTGPRSVQGRQRAIQLLEALTAEFPDVTDYRYELVATYAWIPVSLFPWQGRAAVSRDGEQSLRKALGESKWLVDHNPTVPHYHRCHALVQAKLAVACWRAHRLIEAEGAFQDAVQAQTDVQARSSGGSPHDQVLLQFFRVRLAQVRLERIGRGGDPRQLADCRELLKQCVANLAELIKKPELAGDQLAQTALPLARDVQNELSRPTVVDKTRAKN